MQTLISNLDSSRMHRNREEMDHLLGHFLDQFTRNDWSLSAFVQHLPELVQCAATLDPSHRLPWLIGIHRCWERHGDEFDISAKKNLLALAAAWSDWPLVIAVGESMEPERRADDSLLRYLRDAYYILGDIDSAIDLALAMQFACPDKKNYALEYRYLTEWCNWRHRTLPMNGIVQEENSLRLEPLGHHHVADFIWQYYDPTISELCCLPRFESTADWHGWLDCLHAHGDQNIFAVMHRTWGFIGSVALTLHGNVGFFYYWLGRDFQGYGFGPSAAALLLAAARQYSGLRCCYAKVFEYNTPSRKALGKIGFVDTGICATAPDNDQLFYRIGEEDSDPRIATELHALLEYLESDVRAAVPLTHFFS